MTESHFLAPLGVLAPLSAFLAILALAAEGGAAAQALDADRVKAVAAMLPERPAGVGRPVAEPLQIWRVLFVPGIQSQIPYPLLPYFLAQREPAGGLQGPVPDVEIDLSEGPHLGYALQWFAFSSIALLGGGIWLVRGARGARGTRDARDARYARKQPE